MADRITAQMRRDIIARAIHSRAKISAARKILDDFKCSDQEMRSALHDYAFYSGMYTEQGMALRDLRNMTRW